MDNEIEVPPATTQALQSPFGSRSREELLEAYFADRIIDPRDAWRDVYRLLLWIDPTTGLGHCYESDKSQPGRHWYSRSLAFHAYLCQAFGIDAHEVAGHIDWLFKRVKERLELSEARTAQRRATRAIAQRLAYDDLDMPEPYDDPKLREIIERLAMPLASASASDGAVLDVMQDIRLYVAAENKRKNLLGEGFEDTIAAVIRRLSSGRPASMQTQQRIQDLGGFREPRRGDKVQKVDLAVTTRSGRRILATAKWSVRADREKQLAEDYRIYNDCNAANTPFEYVFLTNEFDAARLVANCDRMESNHRIFDAVVHVNLDALLAAHALTDAQPQPLSDDLRRDDDKDAVKERAAASRLPGLIQSRRLLSLSEWLTDISGPS